MTVKNPHKHIFVALDTTDLNHAMALAECLKGAVGGIKLGKEFFTAQGPQGVKKVAAVGLPLFLDLKYHDIPNTVAGAVREALVLKPFMLNVHASGGEAMMKAALETASEGGESQRPLVLAVTVLTSINDDDLKNTGVDGAVIDQVRRLAALAKDCGLDGVVCSPHEVETLRHDLGKEFKLVTPGIRPDWASNNDQKRVMTPLEAITAGADYLVIGRPITAAGDPEQAAKRIAGELT